MQKTIQIRFIADVALRNGITGAPTSLNQVLEKLDSDMVGEDDAVTMCDYLSFNLLGFEPGEDDHIAILNWLLLGDETEIRYKGTESVFRALKRLVKKIETKYPHYKDYKEPRQLTITYVEGEHRLEADKISQFEQLESYFLLVCEIYCNFN